MMRSIQVLAFLCGLLPLCPTLSAQSLMVNELSNGTSLSKEFFEVVVLGSGPNESCGPVDIRGWILDDNNADFSCGPCASTGIATGHMRFANVAQWSAVPVGSIIVVYNDGDFEAIMPANDPDDTAPHDSVYIVPSGHASLEYSTTPCANPNIPTALSTCGTCAGNGGYTGVCYAASNLWSNVNLRNAGDATQVRRPDGTYFHGFAYGNASSLMSGGPDGLINPITGTGLSFFFNNTSSDDYRQATNWSSVTASSATPGAANSTANRAWIEFLRTDCILPVEYALPLEANPVTEGNLLRWATAIEVNASHYRVMRSESEQGPFEEIGQVPAAGNSSSIHNYRFIDPRPYKQSFYRLEQVDLDGHKHPTDIVEVFTGALSESDLDFWPHPTGDVLHYEVRGMELIRLSLLDGLGREVLARDFDAGTTVASGEISMADLAPGVYFMQVHARNGMVRKKIVHVR